MRDGTEAKGLCNKKNKLSTTANMYQVYKVTSDDDRVEAEILGPTQILRYCL